jgi:response regulator RpfG family c-di-GMP phosphodiesterase
MNTQGRYDLQAPTAQGDGGQKKCVLVVDDDPMNLKVMKGFLTLDGYDAVVAESALRRWSG